MKYYSLYFAQTYGEGAYSEGLYGCTEEQQANGICVPGTGGTDGAGGGLADTGLTVLIFVTLACFIVLVGLLVRIWRRQRPALQEADADQDRGASPDFSDTGRRESID